MGESDSAPAPRIRAGTSTGQRRALRRRQTDAERRLRHLLRVRQADGLKFRRQDAVGPYVLDFYCVDARLGVELDGSQHLDPSSIQRDARRARYLAGRGIRVVRFSDYDVLREPEGVAAAVVRAAPDAAE